jgi:hypothetical protein
VLVVNTDPDEYFFAANRNYSFNVSTRNGEDIAAPASIDRGTFVNGQWVRARRLNGDDIMSGGYDVSGAAAKKQAGTLIPVGGRERHKPVITRVKFYRYH